MLYGGVYVAANQEGFQWEGGIFQLFLEKKKKVNCKEPNSQAGKELGDRKNTSKERNSGEKCF